MMNNLLAQTQNGIQLGPLRGFGKLGLENELPTNADLVFTNFISSAIGLMTLIAIIWFIFSFVIGAMGIIGAGGDKQAMESARKKITTGLVGLVIVIAAIFIIRLIGFLLGIPDILNFVSLFSILTGNNVK